MDNTKLALLCVVAGTGVLAIGEIYDRAKAAWNKRHPPADPFDTPKMRELRKEIDEREKVLGIGKYKKANEKNLTS